MSVATTTVAVRRRFGARPAFWIGVWFALTWGVEPNATRAFAVDGENLDGRVAVAFTPLRAVKGGLHETVATVQNVSDATLFGPMSLVVTGLDGAGVSLADSAGRTPGGDPFVALAVPSAGLRPGKAAKPAVLRFAGASPAFVFGHEVLGLAIESVALPQAPAVAVRVGADTAVPGAPVRVAWKLLGRSAARTKLEIRVRAPGGDANAPGNQWLHHGLGPATGPVSWLDARGRWRDTRVLRRSAASGRLALKLPTSAAGAWTVEVLFADPRTGAPVASGAATVLVSGEPGIYLTVNRTIANGPDAVRATLRTTAGASPRPVRVVAWLVRPDGMQVGLPGLEPGEIDVHAGLSRDDEVRLLDGDFDAEARGAYQVQVRLYDATTRAPLARASAGFEVSDTPAAVTGVVRDAAGAAFDGASAALARVQALDVDDRTVTATAAIGADGAFALTLEPGRYVVSAVVFDAAGVHRAQAPSLVEVDAAGAPVALDLLATAPASLEGKR